MMNDATRVIPQAPNEGPDIEGFFPEAVFDTARAHNALRCPKSLLESYRRRAQKVWLSPSAARVSQRLAEALVNHEGPVWATLVGPFGFGKSATATAIWYYLEQTGVLAVPPLSSTGFESFLEAVAAVLGAAAGDRADAVERAYVRAIRSGRHHGKGRHTADVAVEFMRILCGPEGIFDRGILLCIDEAQQLLGPLDPAALQTLRTFVWGLRTERVNCAVVLSLDPLLHRRLDRWASDILHRIADRGEVLDLRTAYDSSFVAWLWERWQEELQITGDHVLEDDLAVALGQYVEREDLANGPRTVVEVFQRILARREDEYSLEQFVTDLVRGEFRFFSGEHHAQMLIAGLLDDAWVNEKPERRQLVALLAAFPNGCPAEILNRHLPRRQMRDRTRRELFGPLLVNAPYGPALEALQRVRQRTRELDSLVLQCWETQPALGSLMEHGPRLLLAGMVDWWFGNHAEACGRWQKVGGGEATRVRFEGQFDTEFPERRLTVEAGCKPATLGADSDADMVIGLLTASDSVASCQCRIPEDSGLPIAVTFQLPLLRPLEELPPSIERYRKFLEPEPVRPIHLLAALCEVKDHLSNQDVTPPVRQLCDAFIREARDLLTTVLLRGNVWLSADGSLELAGAQLIRALATRALRERFPDYLPIRRIPHWRKEIARYRAALEASDVTPDQRIGRVPIVGDKATIFARLDQRSVAAGDSYVRSLGSLLRAEDADGAYRLWFTPHPLEQWALTCLKERGVSVTSLTDSLRRRGCSIMEAEAVISLLIARGAIARADDGLLVLGDHPGIPAERSAGDVAVERGAREDMGAARAEDLDGRLIDALAELRALDNLESPPRSSLAMHVDAHVQDLAQRVRAAVEKARKLRARISSGEATRAPSEIERRTSEAEDMCRTAIRQHKIVKGWLEAAVALNGLERRVDSLRPRADGITRVLLDRVERCVTRWKEAFATDVEGTLPYSETFLTEMQKLERGLGERVLERRIAFDLRYRDLVELLGWANKEPAPRGLDGDDPIPFEKLDAWALEASRVAHLRLKAAAGRNRWRDPEGTGVGFSELHDRLAHTLAAAEDGGATVEDVAKLVRRLSTGLRSLNLVERNFTNVAAPPDFDELARAFHAGDIEIVVRPKIAGGAR